MSAFIQTDKLTKSYGKSRGILDITFEVQQGTVFGFLGPNGAGKTTAMRTLMGLLRPTSGNATIGGLDCWKQSTAVKKLVGYLPGEFTFDAGMRGGQIIEYLGHLRGGVDQTYVRNLVERLGFDPTKRFREYSRGNKQKLGLVQAFMHKPRLLILDEPTSGLDPLNQQEFYQMLSEVRTQGCTTFLSSHVLPEVEHTCERVAIIREGKLVRIGHVSELKEVQQNGLRSPGSLCDFRPDNVCMYILRASPSSRETGSRKISLDNGGGKMEAEARDIIHSTGKKGICYASTRRSPIASKGKHKPRASRDER
jgi:ABC-2 type transport system ATP-binding protein